MKTFRKYLLRLVTSAPVIGVGILDVLLFSLNVFGVNLTTPTWGYGALLGVGLFIESWRIFVELEKLKTDSNIVCGIYYDNHEAWGDAMNLTIPANPDYRPGFGLVIGADKPGNSYKGVMATFSFYWRGDPPTKGISIFSPKGDDRWQEVFGHITNERPATYKFNGSEEVVTNTAPLLLQYLSFHIVESLKGYILINCEVTTLDPRTSKSAEVVINLTPKQAG